MVTITIPKKEYQLLTEKALRYEYLRQLLEEDIFASPPMKNAKDAVEEFQKSRLYSQKFLQSLKRGVARSSYFRAK